MAQWAKALPPSLKEVSPGDCGRREQTPTIFLFLFFPLCVHYGTYAYAHAYINVDTAHTPPRCVKLKKNIRNQERREDMKAVSIYRAMQLLCVSMPRDAFHC